MITASFLVKDLLIPGRMAPVFWDALVDADLAQNTLGWQWTTGAGRTAAPSLHLQSAAGRKFDRTRLRGKWIPRLAAAFRKNGCMAPWDAPPGVWPRRQLNSVELTLSDRQPRRRSEVALEALARIKSAESGLIR